MTQKRVIDFIFHHLIPISLTEIIFLQKNITISSQRVQSHLNFFVAVVFNVL